MMKIKYSIIIPHHNCPDLLDRCLASIPLKRTDIEVIVVDDNSRDESKVKAVSEKYPSVFFELNKEGKGAGHARNVGLGLAKGEWLIFADSDDFFTENAFEIFDDSISNYIDIVYFKHKSVFSDNMEECNRFPSRNSALDSFLQNPSQKNRELVLYQDVVPWAKIIRKSVVDSHNIMFDEVPASNDVMFVVQAAFYSKDISAVPAETYVVTFRNNSITRIENRTNMFSRFEVALRFKLFLNNVGCRSIKVRVLSRILKAYRTFGIREALRYINVANSYGLSVFTDIYVSPSELICKIKSRLSKNYYQG